MVEEWVSVAQAFSGIGFFGITAWLLVERQGLADKQLEHDGKLIESQKDLAEGINHLASATQDLIHVVDKQTDAFKDLREEIRFSKRVKD